MWYSCVCVLYKYKYIYTFYSKEIIILKNCYLYCINNYITQYAVSERAISITEI